MVLVQKSPFFQLLFFGQYRKGKCLLRYSRTKKLLSRLQKREVQKVEKLTFFQLFFLGNIGHENVFYDILDRKNDFLDYKEKKF